MARRPRSLTPAEEARSCAFCGAGKGERCTNPNGVIYALGEHAVRRGGTSPQRREPPSHPLDERYPVGLCGHCAHPGGKHILAGGCGLCRDCPGWDESNVHPGYWSDRQTFEAEAAMAAGTSDG